MHQMIFSDKAGIVSIPDISYILCMDINWSNIPLKISISFYIRGTSQKHTLCIKPNYISYCFCQFGAQGIIFISAFKCSIPLRLRSCTEIQTRLDGGCEACQGFIRMLEISADRPGPVASSGWWEWICTLMKQIEAEQRGEVNVVWSVCVCVSVPHMPYITCINTNSKLVIVFLKPTWGKKIPPKNERLCITKQDMQRVGEEENWRKLWRAFIIVYKPAAGSNSLKFYSPMCHTIRA